LLLIKLTFRVLGQASPGPGAAYKGRGSNAGNAWAAAAQSWAGGSGRGGGGGRTPRLAEGDITPRGPHVGGENTPSYNRTGGYSTTPR
jgi:phage tail tape-measure protein